MKKNYRGFGFYIVLILVVIGVWYLLDSNQGVNNNYTYAQFEENLKDGDISSVKIDQNREIPTGYFGDHACERNQPEIVCFRCQRGTGSAASV